MKSTPCLVRGQKFAGLFALLLSAVSGSAATADLREAVKARVDAEYPALETIYKNLHAHPE